MGKVLTVFAMSLDGFIADPQDNVHLLYRWMANGDTPVPGAAGRVFMTSKASAEHYRELLETTGAIVTGRRDFDVSRAWGGEPPMGVPTFIVTHRAPQEWLKEGSPFTFVTDGVQIAIKQARQAAGDKNVVVGGTKIVQQCLRAGLVDEIKIDLAPVLLGAGIRLFEALGPEPVELEQIRVIDAPGVAHLQFRVVK
jgi:dihydrofolate reductase